MNLSNYWTNSTNWLEDYSDGLLQMTSMEPCSLKVFDPNIPEFTTNVYIHGNNPNETTYEITVNVDTNNITAFKRFLCCIIIGKMPEQGLDEAIFNLGDMFDFYNKKNFKPTEHSIPSPQGISIGPIEKRRELVLSE